jgi:glycosyltransferase involved in cell wall biosynthesis
MVAPFAAYPKGTVGVRILPMGQALRRRGFGVFVVVPPYDNPSGSGRIYEVDGVKIINIRFFDVPFFKYPLTLLSLVFVIFRLKPNVIYVFKPKGYSGLVGMSVALLKKLVFWISLGLIVDMDDWEGWGGFCDLYYKQSVYPKYMLNFFDSQERWIPSHADVVTVASRLLEERALAWGIPREKIFYVPNGAPSKGFDANVQDVAYLRKRLGLESDKVILLYTRFFEYDLQRVVDVFHHVRQKLENAKLLVVGKGEFGEEERFKELVMEAGLEDSVVFAGWVKLEDVPEYLAVGDVAIYPFDNTILNRAKCPGKLVELMFAGKAVVAEKVGQIAEYMVDGESGVLIESDNVEGFASAIVSILKSENMQRRLGDNARKRVLKVFSWDTLMKNVERSVFCSTGRVNEKKFHNGLRTQNGSLQENVPETIVCRISKESANK